MNHDYRDPGSLISRLLATHTALPDAPAADGDFRWVYIDSSTHHLPMKEAHGIPPLGEFHIAHTARPNGGGQLNFAQRRVAISGYSTFTTAQLEYEAGTWCVPRTWRVSTKVAQKLAGAPYMDSGLTKECSYANGELIVRAGEHERRTRIDGPVTCKPCLFAVVSALARKGEEIDGRFTVLDEFDVPLPGQRLRHRGRIEMQTRGGRMPLHCFEHTGPGTVPGLFWVTDSGAVITYIGGMQGLVLQKADEQAYDYLPIKPATQEAAP